MIIHRLAYLSRIRNVKPGLLTRSLILDNLTTDTWKSTSKIAKEIPVSTNTITYHLRNLERENVVERNQKNRQWRLTVSPQLDLSEFINQV
ncbi:ArsR family transcriptional regulator [Candidatus Thorarchaeota archaeon]|nr:MAG: ArsR family transcriptional regulator [Candidatus Thorarchaeota archaeon]